MSLDKIKKIYHDAVLTDGTITLYVTDDVGISSQLNGEDIYAWDNKGTDYTDKLDRIIADVEANPHTSDDKLLLILQQFRDQLLGSTMAGIEVSDAIKDIPDYNGKTDPLWNKLTEKYNVKRDRKLEIDTYGTRFIFDIPKGVQSVHNAAILRGNFPKTAATKKALTKLRGTNLKLQEDVRNANGFLDFINDVVKDIEENDLNHIAIICKAGHHRSVACAEMLKFLYTNETHVRVNHLTIDK